MANGLQRTKVYVLLRSEKLSFAKYMLFRGFDDACCNRSSLLKGTVG